MFMLCSRSNIKNSHSDHALNHKIEKKVTFQNNDYENKPENSLNLDDYIANKFPFLRVNTNSTRKAKKSKKSGKNKSGKKRSGKNKSGKKKRGKKGKK